MQCGDQRVLIDVGLSCREVVRRLEQRGVAPDSVRAVVITHAHGDHTRGAALFSRRHEVPVYTTAATRAVWGDVTVSSWRELVCGTTHSIDDFRFEPFEVSHDADAETVAFRIDTAAGPIGFATDVGVVTQILRDRFRSCRALVVESNHATDLLRVGPYPSSTKARIGGARGHLSNESLASFLRTDLGSSVEWLVLAHLSQVNNLPELAELTCREALDAAGRSDVRVVVARQDRIAETVELDDRVAEFQYRAPPEHQAVLPF